MSDQVRIGYVTGNDTDEAVSRRLEAVRGRADTSIEIEIVRTVSPVNVRSWTPLDTSRAEPLYVDAFRRAEAMGCQAVVPDGMLDLGADVGRSAVDIPVVAPLQSALHLAAIVGTRIGVIQYTAEYIPQLWASVRKYGMETHVVSILPLGLEMVDLYEQLDEVRERIVRQSRLLIDELAADAIVVTGPGLCPVAVSPEWLSEETGVPILEGIGAPLQVAASLVRLRLAQSRRRWPRDVRLEEGDR